MFAACQLSVHKRHLMWGALLTGYAAICGGIKVALAAFEESVKLERLQRA